MPFREKLKKAFKSSPSSSKTNSPNPDVSASPRPETRWPSNVYAPGEPMPRPKYRAPVQKEHKERLDSFRFGASFRRRKSHQSIYSPMGSRLPSRRGSTMSRPSFQGKERKSVSGPTSPVKAEFGTDPQRARSIAEHSDTDKDGSRANSVSTPGASTPGKRFRDPHGAARPTRLSAEIEQEGDDDVHNGKMMTFAWARPPLSLSSLLFSHPLSHHHPVMTNIIFNTVGLSRVNSQSQVPTRQHHGANSDRPPTAVKADSGPSMKDNRSNGVAAAHDHRPFTEEDLNLALQRSHLAVPAH